MRYEANFSNPAADLDRHEMTGAGEDFHVDMMRLDDGISLTTITGAVRADCDITLPVRSNVVSMVFVQSGRVTMLSKPSGPHFSCAAGCAELAFHRVSPGRTILHSAEQFSAVLIEMPHDYLRKVFCSGCPGVLRGMMGGNPPEFFRREILLSASIQSVLHQMANAQLSEQFRSIFLTSKTYELIALGLERLCMTSSDCNLSPADIERLKRARDILSENLSDPPSIIALAHEVGINDFKLKKGFKALFDTTPFGYLKERRMIAARSELLKGAQSVTTVANLVGYTNLGHFAAAFRKQFGTMPKDVKKISQTQIDRIA